MVVAETLALEEVWPQATTPTVQAPTPATAATAPTGQTTRQQVQWAPATKLAQALAQATTETTPLVIPTAQVVASRATFQAHLNTRPVMDRALDRAPAQAQAMTGTTPPLALAVATALARLAVVVGMAVATLAQDMTETTPPPAVVEA